MWRGAVLRTMFGPPSNDLRTMTLADPLFSSPVPVEVTKVDGPRTPSSDDAPPLFSVTTAPVPSEGIAPDATGVGAGIDCPCSPPWLGACWTTGWTTCLVASGMLRSSRTCYSPLCQYQINVSNVLRDVNQAGVREIQTNGRSGRIPERGT